MFVSSPFWANLQCILHVLILSLFSPRFPGLLHGEGSSLEVRIDVVDVLLEGAVREASARRHLLIGSYISVASELSFPEWFYE